MVSTSWYKKNEGDTFNETFAVKIVAFWMINGEKHDVIINYRQKLRTSIVFTFETREKSAVASLRSIQNGIKYKHIVY